jgi:hypothetical protein
VSPGPRSAIALGAALAALATACSGARPRSKEAARPVGVLAEGEGLGRIDVRRLDARPRLALVSRDGDPAPSVVATVAIDAGPTASAALSALVEGRVKAAGFDVDARADRASFRVRWAGAEAARMPAFLAALSSAFGRPVAPSAPELALVAARVRSLRAQPLEAPELADVAPCTGEIGVAGGDLGAELDAAGIPRELEAWRRESLNAARAAIGAVGPTAFCAAVAASLERSTGWKSGAPPSDPWPAADALAAYAASSIERRGARVTIAVRTADPGAAVAAAERLAMPESPLSLRLAGLPHPWRATAITGTARPRGGCVAVTVETSRHPTPIPIETSVATATELVEREIAYELAGGGSAAAAARQILAATDAREAATRAAWWALSGAVPSATARTAIAVGLPASERAGADLAPVRAKLAAELARAGTPPVAERRVIVERGQGELWLLLASPCGSAEEGEQDAAATALAVLAAIESRRPDDVAVEPWITPDGIGVLAHGAPRDEHEPAADLARRVANAAARTLTAAPLTAEGLANARSLALRQLERTSGPQGAALDAFIGAVAPDHPSWLEPLGPWGRTANAGLEAIRLRRQALASGPLRVAVLANVDAAQGAAAADAVARWLPPRAADGACHAGPAGPTKPGRYDAKLPADAPLGQALIGLGVPSLGAPGHDLAELTALALDGEGGVLAGALSAPLAARASARLLGGARSAALVVDVRAPADSLDAAIAEAKSALAKLAQGGATDALLARAASAASRRRRLADADPRRRLVDAWSGAPATRATPTLAAWRDWLSSTLREPSFVVVEARPD